MFITSHVALCVGGTILYPFILSMRGRPITAYDLIYARNLIPGIYGWI